MNERPFNVASTSRQAPGGALPMATAAGPVLERTLQVASAIASGWESLPVRVLLRNQVLRLSIPSTVDISAPFAFRDPANRKWLLEDRLASVIPCIRPYGPFVGAGELLVKAKQFDDGLCAAVEIASQEACGSFSGKRPLLRALRDQITGEGCAASHVEAACVPGGRDSVRTAAAARVLGDFLGDERSHPLGFYIWNDELRRIFQQDRLLQSDLSDAEDAGQLANALATDSALRAGYLQCLRLSERLGNRLACADFRQWITAIDQGVGMPPIDKSFPFPPWLALFPPSRAHETDLAKQRYRDHPVPADADLLREFIAGIRASTIDLSPRSDSGWYDWQTWALEPLVAPERTEEAGRLVMTMSYREYLERLFGAALALGRETQIKQLETPVVGSAPIPSPVVLPQLHVEPLATHYARRAASYRFIATVLVELFGEAALNRLHRLRPEGPVERTLAEELEFMTQLFEGAANVARLELGASCSGETSTFLRWMATRSQDADIVADLRMMVPVYKDRGRAQTRVWMFLGWLEDTIEVSFEHAPEVQTTAGQRVDAVFRHTSYPIAVPVIVEAAVSRILDREEFRATCDRCRTPAAVVRALQ